MLNTVPLLSLVIFWYEKYLKPYCFDMDIGVTIDHFINQVKIPENQLLSKEYRYMSQQI